MEEFPSLQVKPYLFVTLVIVVLSFPLPLSALTLTKDQNLDFGKLIGGTGLSGTVTVAASGARSASGAVRLLGTVWSPARFTITGSPLQEYTLTLPPSVTLTSGTDSMEVTSLIASVPVTGQLPPGGTVSFFLGGTLSVKSTQSNTAYTGDINITVK